MFLLIYIAVDVQPLAMGEVGGGGVMAPPYLKKKKIFDIYIDFFKK